MGELTHHRIRFYPGKWSTFDTVEPCTSGDKPCIGCQFKHPRCTEDGRVPPTTKT